MRKALLIFAILFLSPIVAASPLPRKILALYDSKEFPNLVDTPIHRHAEVWLNHLGLDVVYQPIDSKLPSNLPEDLLGLITWFTTFDAVKNPVPYCRWLEKQIRGGKKVVILEEPGIFKTREMEINRDCFKALHSLGIDTLGFYSDNPYYYEIVEKDPSLVEFERKIDLTEGLPYSLVRAGSPGAKSYLKARRLDMKESLSDLVVTTPHGGFAHPSYVTYGKKELGKLQWRLNPFLFFERALGLEGRPRPDITTLNGVRTFFSHIDGDGLLNVSEIDRKSYSGEIILSEILKKQTSIPITASFITGYLDLPEFKNERVMKLHQEILSLPNIEAGAHGYAHPLIWGREDGKLAIKIPGYRFDHEKEISGSIRMVNHLLAAGQIQKRTKLFQWTGDCLQSREDLRVANQSEIPNINGGEPRFDGRFDSYAFVAPISAPFPPYRQIYSAAPNENVYTNLWKEKFYGYREVLETFENTGSPIRLKPINIYYHYYSGEKLAALKALRDVYEAVLRQEIFPITASEYARTAQEFFNAGIEQVGDGYQIRDQGLVRTIRFDHDSRNVALDRSPGVLGFLHDQGSLYVHLDESTEHGIFLTSAKPSRPFVEKATFWIQNFKADPQKISFEKKGWHRSQITLAGVLPNQLFRIETGDTALRQKSDAQGRLSVEFPGAENGGDFQRVIIRHVPDKN